MDFQRHRINQAEFTIYATADLHGHLERLDRVAKNVAAMKPDVLVIAGDITGPREPAVYIGRLNDLPVPVLAVRGNMDSQETVRLLEQCPNITSLHQKKTTINGVSFIGVDGTIPVPFSSRICLREEQTIETLDHLVRTDSVLVAHPPPYGTLDEGFGSFHAGSRGLRRFIVKKQPRMLICGHIHERPGWALIEKTLVVNCSMGRSGAGALVELCGDVMPTVHML